MTPELPKAELPLIERGAVLENPEGMLALVTKIENGLMHYVTEEGAKGFCPVTASWLGEATNIYHPQQNAEPVQTKVTHPAVGDEQGLLGDYWREMGAMLALHPNTPLKDVFTLTRAALKIGLLKALPEIQKEFRRIEASHAAQGER